MKRKIKWALIGCGKVVLKNKTTPFKNFNNTITAICTTNIKHSINARKKLKLKKCNCYDNIYDLLNNEKFDAIYICTPPKYHFEYLKLLHNFNIPLIYVEKPFVLNLNQAKQIEKIYRNSNTKIFIAHYKRLMKKFVKLKYLIQKNIIGKVNKIEGSFDRPFNKDHLKSWIYNKEISGGGRFFDIGPHIIDILYNIFGNISDIQSKVLYNKPEHSCENHLTTNFKIDNIKCFLSFDFDAQIEKDIIIIYGEKGYIETSINRNKPINIYNKNKKLIKSYKFKRPKTWGIETVKAIDKIIFKKKNNPNLVNLEQAIEIQSYIEKILTNNK